MNARPASLHLHSRLHPLQTTRLYRAHCCTCPYSRFTLENLLRKVLPTTDTPAGPHNSHLTIKLLGLCRDSVCMQMQYVDTDWNSNLWLRLIFIEYGVQWFIALFVAFAQVCSPPETMRTAIIFWFVRKSNALLFSYAAGVIYFYDDVCSGKVQSLCIQSILPSVYDNISWMSRISMHSPVYVCNLYPSLDAYYEDVSYIHSPATQSPVLYVRWRKFPQFWNCINVTQLSRMF